MTWLIFIGDMMIMFFMICLVVWVALRVNQRTVDKSSRIPLEDEVIVESEDEQNRQSEQSEQSGEQK